MAVFRVEFLNHADRVFRSCVTSALTTSGLGRGVNFDLTLADDIEFGMAIDLSTSKNTNGP
jgi:hypothetical protein